MIDTAPNGNDADLERRLREAFAVVMPLLDESAVPAPTRLGKRRSWLRAAASVLVVAGGATAIVAMNRDDAPQILTSPSSTVQPSTTSSTPGSDADTITLTMSDGDDGTSPWDPIRIAPGTVGWYDIAADNAAELGERTAWSDVYISRFMRCVDGAMDGDEPVCSELATGGREFISYGDEVLGVGIGTHLGPADPEVLLWSLASGSLWGYDSMPEPPGPDEVPIGDRAGYEYRNGDAAYLLWEQEPGVFVWFFSHGLDRSTLVSLARSVEPAELPGTLPVLLSLDAAESGFPDTSDFVELVDRLLVGWVDGRPCATFGGFVTCTPLDDGARMLVDGNPEGELGAIAAVAPTGSTVGLDIERFDLPWFTAEPTASRFGFDSYVYRAETERVINARLFTDGSIVDERAFGTETMLRGFPADVVAEGRTADTAWVVVRQDPESAIVGSALYGDPGDYCWILLPAGTDYAPLCPFGDPPASGLGQHAVNPGRLDIVEVAANVESASCGDEELAIYTDPKLDDRRFVVSPCDYGEITTS